MGFVVKKDSRNLGVGNTLIKKIKRILLNHYELKDIRKHNNTA